ncbi:MAG TPA: CRISPR-associated protein Cas4 [Bacteroidales bacterium]|nr:CRISPR-associated protein Cas4 [Bacteroidales bacterium]
MLSGIQHIAFCERQYALIYIEQQWNENLFTAEGRVLHERVDDFTKSESRGAVQFIRAVPLVSYELGLYGRADLVELRRVESANIENAIVVPGKHGLWKVIPVEYKRGIPKPTNCDIVQLCAQAICLEEMNNITINEGFMYYGQPHKRYAVQFTQSLRDQVADLSQRMHELFSAGKTPLPVYKKHCHSCSMFGYCQPNTFSKGQNATDYLETHLGQTE